MSKKFTVGDVVFALWPGSNKYYEATVLSIGKSTVEVNFKDGYRTELPQRKVFVRQYFVTYVIILLPVLSMFFK